jgi:uncharacterized protein
MEKPLFANAQIDLARLPRVAGVDWSKLERAYLRVQMLSLWFFRLLILGIFLFTLGVQGDIPLWLMGAISGGWILLLLLSTYIVYRAFRIKGYAVRQRDLMYRSGLLFRKTTVIPYSRIQHSEVHQGVIERQFGLARLAIYTAGGSQSDLTIPGLTKERAEQMRTFVSEKVASDEEE